MLLLPWKHKRSDLDTCFSIFKAFKPFHKPGEGVSLAVKISGSKRILSWVAKISQFWSSQFSQCSYPWPSSRQWLARCCQNFSSAPCSQVQLASLHQNCTEWESILVENVTLRVFWYQLSLTCKSVSMFVEKAVSNMKPVIVNCQIPLLPCYYCDVSRKEVSDTKSTTLGTNFVLILYLSTA